MRDLVSGLLEQRGCVALQWEKLDTGGLGRGGWVVAYKRWFFSNHFSPVNRWGVNADAAVIEHMKKCPFNIKTSHTKPNVNSPQWKELMNSLTSRLRYKRDSEWFIN